jgi:hypothetical protein
MNDDKLHRIKIQSYQGRGTVVEIDDFPIQDIVSALWFSLDADAHRPKVRLHLDIDYIALATIGEVTLDEQTITALERIGWRPPEPEE